jgi:anti-sigma-K factor RskA
MSTATNAESLNPSDRALILAAGYALGDLSAEEQREWDSLDLARRQLESNDFDSAASRVFLTYHETMPEKEMPVELRRSIQSAGTALVRLRQAPSADVVAAPKREGSGRLSIREAFVWAALAASLMLIVGVESARWAALDGRTAQQAGPRSLTLAEQRQALIDSSSDRLIQTAWAPGKTSFPALDGQEASVTGDVIWDSNTQTGYMRFVGLPKNDPMSEQYQLWIVDPTRDDEPVDGGVFDSTDGDELIVPIHAKLGVSTPTLFAITIEKPGGVVVSTQERLPLLAMVSNK